MIKKSRNAKAGDVVRCWVTGSGHQGEIGKVIARRKTEHGFYECTIKLDRDKETDRVVYLCQGATLGFQLEIDWQNFINPQPITGKDKQNEKK